MEVEVPRMRRVQEDRRNKSNEHGEFKHPFRKSTESLSGCWEDSAIGRHGGYNVVSEDF